MAHKDVMQQWIDYKAPADKYGEQIMAMKNKKPAPYTEKLLFDRRSGTGDPDKPITMMGMDNSKH